MITLARSLDMLVMLGCFVCSSLAIAPALTIATLVDHAGPGWPPASGGRPVRGHRV